MMLMRWKAEVAGALKPRSGHTQHMRNKAKHSTMFFLHWALRVLFGCLRADRVLLACLRADRKSQFWAD